MIATFLTVFCTYAWAMEVVCTLPWLGDLARRLAPDAHVTTLARGVDDPHFLSPTPALIARVTGADLYVENGLGLELWSEKLRDGAGNPAIRPGQPGFVRATAGMRILDVPADLSRARGDLHASGNPHVWLDPLNAPIAADNIAAGLARVDPANATAYLSRARAFRTQVHEAMFGTDLVTFMGGDLLARLSTSHQLDAFLAEKGLADRLGGWARKGAALRGQPTVFAHQSWPYFIDRFGLDAVGYIEERPGIPATAAHRDALIDVIRARGVRVIEVTSWYDDRVPRALAAATGARVAIVAEDVGGTAEVSDWFALIDALVTGLQP
jgi:zinc/manganese transport system substrate-binding protein